MGIKIIKEWYRYLKPTRKAILQKQRTHVDYIKHLQEGTILFIK